ncbi:DUF6318 family protein [Angustibacter luteus]|uniref:DUF6318 family protein n=1 Tax=Angustibacter luteus TaxID=658456 RepID=A0ABW1JHE0_9ACTN
MIIKGWVAAAAVVVGLGLAGCSGGGEVAARPSHHTPTAEPGGSASSAGSATASPSGTSSVDAAYAKVPKAARAHTYAAAQAFAEFYVGQFNLAWAKPDPDAIRPYAASRCKSCAAYAQTASELVRDHQRVDGDVVTIRASSWMPESTMRTALVRIVNVQEARKVLDATGRTAWTIKREPNEQEFEVGWDNGRWLINEVRYVEVKR